MFQRVGGLALGRCVVRFWVLGAVLASLARPGIAAPQNPPLNPRLPVYYPVSLDDHGKVSGADLEALTRELAPEIQDQPTQLVVLIHGYDTSMDLGRHEYRKIAREMKEEADRAGLRIAVIGVHWPSYPGRWQDWIPQMLGYRFTSELGFRHAIRNPYLEKVSLAAECGRRGLRTLLFRLQGAFPGTPINLLAHSMGGEMAVRALSPIDPHAAMDPETTYPERTLRVQTAVLAGADLDNDVFRSDAKDSAEPALGRARLWWITVPRKNAADAALELRRTAGRRDAVGNVGLTLDRTDFDDLMRRGALVLDDEHVPIGHDMTRYYAQPRLKSLVLALLYEEDPGLSAARQSNLARLAALRAEPVEQLPEPSHAGSVTARLLIRWRLHPERNDFGMVRIATREAQGSLHTKRNPLYNRIVAQPAGCGAA